MLISVFFLLIPSISTFHWIFGGLASGGSLRSMPLCTLAACLSLLVSPFSCLVPGITCHLFMASCEFYGGFALYRDHSGLGYFFCLFFFKKKIIIWLTIIRIHIQTHSYKAHCQILWDSKNKKKCFLFFKNVMML